MSKTWNEYILWTLSRINDCHAKSMLLHLNKYSDRYWTPRELKQVLNLDIDEDKRTKTKTGLKLIKDFQEKIEAYAQQFPDVVILLAFLSLGGFTDEAMQQCQSVGIATTEGITLQLNL
ncbi:MAG: hypothetical protein B6242_13025 [Anaerolineaceae bacterium 4572_78]|nr:MAG: hypothetical protein B6242_13025 [Anaerolineaceae bacterium 4572_78]